MVYCVVPEELAKLAGPLRRHFEDEPSLEVIVERRRGERRRKPDRRRGGAAPAPRTEKRRIINANGRRIGERRAMTVPVTPPELPRRFRRHAGQLVFCERIELPAQQREDIDTGRLVIRFQAGEHDVFRILYERYFDRVYSYLRMALKDSHEAEDATQEVFIQALQNLHAYETRAVPFRGWLFRLVRNHSINLLIKRQRSEVEDPEDVCRRQEDGERQHATREHDDLAVLDWISDKDLTILVERLPCSQRQVLLLRYMLGLNSPEIAQVMGRSPAAVRQLHQRAIGFLHQRLTALGRAPRHSGRQPVRRLRRKANVLRSRRFALL